MKNILLITGTYIAAIIGAGFASGTEVIGFFVKYGKLSFFGVILSALLFGLFAYILLKSCVGGNIHSFEGYLRSLMGKKAAVATEVIIVIFMVSVFSAMIAAMGELAYDIGGISRRYGAMALCALCFIIFLFRIEGLVTMNGILGIAIGMGVIVSCLYMGLNRFAYSFRPMNNWGVSAVAYTSYNALSSAVILCDMSKLLKNKKEARAVGVFAGIGIFCILLCVWALIQLYYGKIQMGAIPMLTIAARQGKLFYYGYAVVLFLAIVTTALTNGYGMTDCGCRYFSRPVAALIAVCGAFFISGLGFDSLVDRVYRVCGYAGLILPFFMIRKELKFLRNRVIRRKKEKIEEKRCVNS